MGLAHFGTVFFTLQAVDIERRYASATESRLPSFNHFGVAQNPRKPTTHRFQRKHFWDLPDLYHRRLRKISPPSISSSASFGTNLGASERPKNRGILRSSCFLLVAQCSTKYVFFFLGVALAVIFSLDFDVLLWNCCDVVWLSLHELQNGYIYNTRERPRIN